MVYTYVYSPNYPNSQKNPGIFSWEIHHPNMPGVSHVFTNPRHHCMLIFLCQLAIDYLRLLPWGSRNHDKEPKILPHLWSLQEKREWKTVFWGQKMIEIWKRHLHPTHVFLIYQQWSLLRLWIYIHVCVCIYIYIYLYIYICPKSLYIYTSFHLNFHHGQAANSIPLGWKDQDPQGHDCHDFPAHWHLKKNASDEKSPTQGGVSWIEPLVFVSLSSGPFVNG